ncbi:unnamed protein product [Mytilus edulis]|uniref:Uncharacterized protein n=1 Tax=Mytilus edulis TaxID=6550 RepID=A0A8S3UKV1_MYTED|nr:unnamed protein product [Mytilus edulis]
MQLKKGGYSRKDCTMIGREKQPRKAQNSVCYIENRHHTVNVNALLDDANVCITTMILFQRGSIHSATLPRRRMDQLYMPDTSITTVSIPRLELMAAVLGLRLALSVKHASQVPDDTMTFWLARINFCIGLEAGEDLTPFVSNQIGEIHTSSHPKQRRRHFYKKKNRNGRKLIFRNKTYMIQNSSVKRNQQKLN